jgi:hypothetical protein
MAGQVDFYTMLSGLGDTIAAKRKEAVRKEALAGAIGPDGQVDFQKAILGFTQLGDVEGAARIAQIAGQNEDRRFRRDESARAQSNADRTFGLQDRIFNRKEVPEPVRVLEAAGIDPKSPEGRKTLFPKTDTPISAGDKKAVMAAEDELPNIEGTIDALKTAKQLNDKTFTGVTAGIRGKIGTSGVPGANMLVDRDAALATSEFGKVMSGEAIKTMADTLKGATTDFELKKFETMLADPTTPPEIRGRTIDRMIKLAEKQREIKSRRINELRSGNYFKEGAAAPATDPLQRARDAIARGANREAVIKRLVEAGIKPEGL